MTHAYDELTEESLRKLHGAKWNHYASDILPMWVADMDFPIAGEIRQAIRDYAECNDFGYPMPAGIPGLLDAVTDHLDSAHGVRFTHEQVMMTSGIIPSLYLSTLALAGPGDEVVVQPPVYPPFSMAVTGTGRTLVENPMRLQDGNWELDLENLEQLITPATRMLILCNPQNPTGRVFSRAELEALGEVVLRHNLWVISDELHADLVLEGKHVPFAAVSSELAQRTITLFGPTKTFNIAGLKIGFALSHNEALLGRLRQQAAGVLTPPNVLAQAAARAAFTEAGEWHANTISYLRSNRDLLADFVARELPAVRMYVPEGTYLAWLDFNSVVPADQLEHFLHSECHLGLNVGDSYGTGGKGFARINFATGRQVLEEGLARLKRGLEARMSTILADSEPVDKPVT